MNSTLLQLRYWKKRAAELDLKRTRTQIVVAQLKEALSVLPPPKPVRIEVPKGNYSPEHLVVLCSDAQAGTEVIGADLGNPKWDYNTNIFRYRLRLYFKGLLEVVSRHRQAYPVTDCTVWLGGDLLENERTYKPQMTFIDTNVLNQFYMVQYEIARFLSSLSAVFRHVKVVTSVGN